MDKNASYRIVKETFESEFDKERFLIFAKNLCNKVDESKAFHAHGYVPEVFKPFVKTYERLATYTDPEGKKIDILVVYLQKESSLERARTAQRNFVARYLKDRDQKDAGLVAFVAPEPKDWRFSLIKMEYKFSEGKSGKIKVKEEFTPARRWSFLVGAHENSHTAQSRLAPILQEDELNPTLGALEECFNIEKVTQEFFEKYRELYLQVKETLDDIVKKDRAIREDFTEKGVDTVNFSKKLLGQIVFLYFLQKKGWFGVERDCGWGTGPKNFLRQLFEQKHGKYKNLFNDILEPLFYEALARERDDDFYSRFNCKIPFLNGGLFDPINNYDWVHTDILIPNDLFSNKRKTKEGDIGNGILDVFDRYNFTVKEDEPLEKEVAVDPEMLGKVFENLLEVKDRKSKGTYYTPREIVHYMCVQSLVNYLATELSGKVSKEECEKLIKYGESVGENEARVEEKGEETQTYYYKLPESIRTNAKLIDEKLTDIKVCDPAIGSGAFPVGMMTEIVRTRNTLSSYIKDSGRTLYNFKRDCIHNSLYGVDIDPSAVEIAKLRLWLSLVVDEDDIRQIKPLPNLDYKIMQGNSLLEEYEGVRLFDDKLISTVNFDKEKQVTDLKEKQAELSSEYIRLHQADNLTRDKRAQIDEELKKINSQIKKLEQSGKKVEQNASLFDVYSTAKKKADDLKRLHKEFFETTQKRKKDELKKQIEKLEWDLIETTLREQNKTPELKKLESLKKANIKPFFLWKLHFTDVFQEKGGFDVVIANPPYNAELSDKERELYKNIFESVRAGRQDTAAIFVEVAKRISNSDMQFSFILPFRLFSRKRNHGQFQIYTLNNFSILSILYLGSNVGFSANDEFMILVMTSRVDNKNRIHVAFKPALADLWDSRIFTKIDQSLLVEKGEVNLNIARYDMDLLKKINSECLSLETICHVKDGIVPFIREKLVKDKKIDSRYVRFAGIAGRYHLLKYYFSCDDLWLCYDIKEAMKYIKNKVELRKVQLRDREIFLHRKILTAQNSAVLKGSIDENKIFASNSLHSTYLKEEYEENFYLEYILALINSPAINYYHNSLRQKGTDLHPQILVGDLKKLPIKNIPIAEQEVFKKLVTKILEITTNSNDFLENYSKQAEVEKHAKRLNEMVYDLYNLTPEETVKVENSNNSGLNNGQ